MTDPIRPPARRDDYPYSLSALRACEMCASLQERHAVFGPGLDRVVRHHAEHRLGLCCRDPETKVA